MAIAKLIKQRLRNLRSWSGIKSFVYEGTYFLGRYTRYWRDLIFPLSVKHLYGPEQLTLADNDFVVLCLVRDGEEYVHAFVQHYLELGARHLVFLDNGSKDQTVQRLREYKQVTVLQSTWPYKIYKLAIRRYLVRRFAKQHWSLFADIDEFFDFPFSDRVQLKEVLGYLRDQGFNTILAHMLDMLPADRPADSDHNDLLQLCPYYETRDLRWGDYEHHFGERNKLPDIELKTCHDGVRKRLFDAHPLLSRHPLVFLDQEISPYCYSAHNVCDARLADFTAVLYHFKFLEGFETKIRKAAAEGNYHDGSRMYKKALEVLEEQDDITLCGPDARRLKDVNQLLDEGFLVASNRFLDWVGQNSDSSSEPTTG